MRRNALEIAVKRGHEVDRPGSEVAMQDYRVLSLLCKLEKDCKALIKALNKLDEIETDKDLIKLKVLVKNTLTMAQNNELKKEAIKLTVRAIEQNMIALNA